MRNLDLAAELGARTYVFWGGREGAESGAAKDIRAALDRYAEGMNLLSQYVLTPLCQDVTDQLAVRLALEYRPHPGLVLVAIVRARVQHVDGGIVDDDRA